MRRDGGKTKGRGERGRGRRRGNEGGRRERKKKKGGRREEDGEERSEEEGWLLTSGNLVNTKEKNSITDSLPHCSL